jgi:hypothetical protein
LRLLTKGFTSCGAGSVSIPFLLLDAQGVSWRETLT